MKDYSSYLYKKQSPRWQIAKDFYDGDAFSKDKISEYLQIKALREANEQYEERKKKADPELHFGTLIDSLNGSLHSNEDQTQVNWGSLGDPEDSKSIAYRLDNSINGKGLNFITQGKIVSGRMLLFREVWGLVDGITRDGEGNQIGDATIHVIDPLEIIDYEEDDLTGRMNFVRVKRMITKRKAGLEDSNEMIPLYFDYTLEGWKKWVEDEKENQYTLDEGTYTFYRTSERNSFDLILPIFRIQLPITRNVGYLLALKSKSLFNRVSIRDFAEGNISFAMLNLAGTKDFIETNISNLSKGSSALYQTSEGNENKFISPPSEFLTEVNESIREDIKAFYINGFKMFNDAARERSATESRIEHQTGIEAFLRLAIGALDEFDNMAMFLLEQVYFPETPSNWGEASVVRSKDFTPQNVKELAQLFISNFIDGDTPITPTQMIQGLEELVYPLFGIEVKEDEIKSHVESFISRKSQERDMSNAFGV